MRITRKGQVTIPKEVRDRAGLTAGSEVEFVVEGDVVILRKVESRRKPGMSRGEKIVAAIRGTRSVNRELSTDEIMKLLRGDEQEIVDALERLRGSATVKMTTEEIMALTRGER